MNINLLATDFFGTNSDAVINQAIKGLKVQQMKFEVGDIVQIARKLTKSEALNWNDEWVPQMDSWVGHTAIVTGHAHGRDDSIQLYRNDVDIDIYREFWFPTCVLKKLTNVENTEDSSALQDIGTLHSLGLW